MMKLDLQNLKNLLRSIQKHKVKQVKIVGYNFELLINSLQKQSLNRIQKTATINLHKDIENTKNEKNDPDSDSNKKKQRIKYPAKHLTIVSPMIGTFYRAASPEESPFVKVLDQVKSNQTVCIIEAMKLMNEIEAEVNGKIIDILVEDGEFVDCGQALMIVEPTTT